MCLTPKLIHHPIASFMTNPDITEIDNSNHNIDYLTVPKCKYTTDATEINTSGSSLNILQYNIRGLINKQDDLKLLLKDNNVDIALICETWLNDYNMSRVDIPGYNLVSMNRENKKGGGVCILVRENLKYREFANTPKPSTFELVTIELKTSKNNILVSSAYRPPSTKPAEFVKEYVQIMTDQHKSGLKSIVGMDHILDLLKHESHKPTEDFIENLYGMDCYPAITKSTRITKSSATLIDNIFLDIMYEGSSKSYIMVDDLSDHLPSIISIEGLSKYETTRKVTKRKMNQKKLDRIKDDLSNKQWHELLQHLDTQKSFTTFHEIVTDIIETHAPIKECKVKNKGTGWIQIIRTQFI